MAETQTDNAMAPLQSAACICRIALGPRADQPFDAPPTQQRSPLSVCPLCATTLVSHTSPAGLFWLLGSLSVPVISLELDERVASEQLRDNIYFGYS